MNHPQVKTVRIDGLHLNYLDWTNESSPHVILLHGLCGNAHYWDFLASSLNQEFHCIALDQRGHGDSDWAAAYGPHGYVSDLEDLVQQLNLTEFTLICHSLGGINAILYAAIHPDHVNKLVIIDIGPDLAKKGLQRLNAVMENEPDSFSSLNQVYDYLKNINEFCSHDFLNYQIPYAVITDNDGQYLFKFDPALRQTNMNSPCWVWDYLKDILCPVLLLRGSESDLLESDTAQRMKNLIPFCSLKEIQRAGHGIPGDNPDSFHHEVTLFLRE